MRMANLKEMLAFVICVKNPFNWLFKCMMMLLCVTRMYIISLTNIAILRTFVSLKPYSRRNKEKRICISSRVILIPSHMENEDDEKAKKLRWMHLQQQKQSLSWADEDEDVGGVGLRIIVIKNMFSLEETTSTR